MAVGGFNKLNKISLNTLETYDSAEINGQQLTPNFCRNVMVMVLQHKNNKFFVVGGNDELQMHEERHVAWYVAANLQIRFFLRKNVFVSIL